MELLQVNNLKKVYTTRFGGNSIEALKNVSFSVEEGEYVAIMGESGSGKTTLLNILASLDKPTSGEVLLEGKNIVKLNEKEISSLYQLIYDVLNNDTLIKSKKSEISYIGLPDNVYQLIYDFVYG